MRTIISLLLFLFAHVAFAQPVLHLLDRYDSKYGTPSPRYMGTVNSRMVITAFDGFAHSLYTYTPDGLYQVDKYDDIRLVGGCSAGGYIFFVNPATVALPAGLYKWDGNTTPQHISVVPAACTITALKGAINNKVYFTARDCDSNKSGCYEYDPATDRVKVIATSKTGVVLPAKLSQDSLLHYFIPDTAIQYTWHTYNPYTGAYNKLGTIKAYPSFIRTIKEEVYFNSYGVGNYEGYLSKLDKNGTITRLTDSGKMQPSTPLYFCNDKIYFSGKDTMLYAYDVNAQKLNIAYNLRKDSIMQAFNFSAYNGSLFFAGRGNYAYYSIYKYDDQKQALQKIRSEDTGTLYLANSNDMFTYANTLYVAGTNYVLYYKETDAPITDSGYTIYPNPASTHINIKAATNVTQNLSLTLHDAVGHKVMSQQLGTFTAGHHTISVPLAHISAGVYMYTLRGNTGILLRGKLSKL